MRKFTLLLLMATLFAASAVAQTSDFPLQFADAAGNVISDGSELYFTEYVEDDFGDLQMPTHLYVKNTSGSDVQAGAIYEILTLDGGAFQTCFPENCMQQRFVGSYQSQSGLIRAGELKDMQTEWLPDEEGQAVVTYQLITFRQNVITKKWMIDGYGPKITLNFGTDPTGIQEMKNEIMRNENGVACYDLLGRQTDSRRTASAIRLLRMPDGGVRKVLNQVVK